MSARRPAIVVHDLDQATAALRASAAAGVPVTLWSAPGAAAYAGLGFLRAVLSQAAEAVPEADHDAVVDCRGSAVLAHEALEPWLRRRGLRRPRRNAQGAPGHRGRARRGGSSPPGRGGGRSISPIPPRPSATARIIWRIGAARRL